MSADQVILVVDRAYGRRIEELPTSAALWLVDSPENRPFISSLKERFTTDVRGDLTWFQDSPVLSPAGLAAEKLDTIEDHHGEYAQQPPYSRLRILGAEPDPELMAFLQEFGFRQEAAQDQVIELRR